MPNTHKLAFIDKALTTRTQKKLLRTLQTFEPADAITVCKHGKTLIDFSGNDYLGLSKHPQIIAAVQKYAQRYGVGSTASRLVSGNYSIHEELENKLAISYGSESALLFSTGFQANSTVLSVLADRNSLILCDRLIHNSLIQGIIASRAQFIRYRHQDLEHLEKLLSHHASKNYNRIVIVSETVFSMDGDYLPPTPLIQLAQQYQAILYLDDAHAFGVLGKNGMGLTAGQKGVDVAIGTFGKAFGSFGAFITCSNKIRDYLVNTCSGIIYTTALPPPIIGAIIAALDLMPQLESQRQFLQQQAQVLREQLQALRYSTGASNSQIVPMILGDESKALSLTRWLENQGILVAAIRPPTVPVGTARIRITLSSQHRKEHYSRLVQAIQSWK